MVSHMLVSTVPYISTILPVGTLVLRLFHTLNDYHKQLCTSITSHIFVKRYGSRGLGDVYKRQPLISSSKDLQPHFLPSLMPL